MSETEERQMAAMQEGARRGYATRTKRRRKAMMHQRQQQSEARDEIGQPEDKIGYP